MRRTTKVWKYFIAVNKPERKAQCKCCSKVLSYKSSITNLKTHLSVKHRSLFEKFKTENSTSEITDESAELDVMEELVGQNFELLDGGMARCEQCGMEMEELTDILADHLRRRHPESVPNPHTPSAQRVAKSERSEEDEDGFTEVVYLNAEDPMATAGSSKSQARRKLTRRSSIYRPANDVDDVRTKSSDCERCAKGKLQDGAKPSEMDVFVQYISCLMQNLPKDVCTKLQLDIVNLIMHARLNSEAEAKRNAESTTQNNEVIPLTIAVSYPPNQNPP